jgi:ferritin
MMKTSLLSASDKKKLNQAVEHELYASNFYKYAASCCQKYGLFGAQKFFEKESADELEHYYKLRDFFNDRGDEAEMPQIDAVDFKEGIDLMGILEAAYELEKDLGDFYNEFYFATKDATVHARIQKFVKIQTKAVGEYGDLIARLGLVVECPGGLLIFDQELGNK